MDYSSTDSDRCSGMTLLSFVLIVSLATYTASVLVGHPDSDSLDNDHLQNGTTNLWTCFAEPRYLARETVEEMSESVFTCAKRNLYLGLIRHAEDECIDIGDGVTFVAEHGDAMSPREIFPTDEEPATFRRIVDGYSSFLSRRAARWDLGFLYPGLVMRIGPTMNSAGVLEFALEKRLDYNDRSKLRPGQLIIRRTILPALLGFRMNLVSLMPVLLGVLLFVSKNAFVFSKLSLVMSILLALKSLFLAQQMKPTSTETYDVVETGSVSQSGVIGVVGGHRPRPLLPDNLLLEMFTATAPPFRGVNDSPQSLRDKGRRNFAWERRE